MDISGTQQQQRAIINTYLSLASCCVTTFITTILLTPENKVDIVHIQNSTLAGGVAIGAAANLILQPYGSLLVGCAAGVVSVVGFRFLGVFLERKWGVTDTCGVHNLHGLPAIFGGLIAAILTAVATEDEYGEGLYNVFPGMVSRNGTGRSSVEQGGFQLLGFVVTLIISITSGLLTGWFRFQIRKSVVKMKF